MDSNPKNTIQELKEAGNELKENKDFTFEEKSSQTNRRPKDEANLPKNINKKNIDEYQDELQNEKSRLEKAHQEIKDLEQKLVARIELLNKLQDRSTEINKALEEFQTEFAQLKGENSNIMRQVKNELENYG